jgi:hypothetical protein
MLPNLFLVVALTATPRACPAPITVTFHGYQHLQPGKLDLAFRRWQDHDNAEPVAQVYSGGDLYREPDGDECRLKQYGDEDGVNPDYQITSVYMVADRLDNPSENVAEVWVYKPTSENMKLDTTIIQG